MVALARSLVLSETLGYDALAQALLECAIRRTSFVEALVSTRAIDLDRLEAALDAPRSGPLCRVVPLIPFVALLPYGLCERLFAVPVAHDPTTGTVDIAVADVDDPHALEEMRFWLGAPVRAVRATLASLQAAIGGLAEDIDGPSTRRGPFVIASDAGDGAAGPTDGDGAAGPTDGDGAAGPTDGDGAAAPTSERRGRPRDGGARAGMATGALAATGAGARDAAARDQVFELLVATSRTLAPRVVVLVIQHGALVPWACSPEVGSPELLHRWRLPLATRSVLREALDRGHAAWVRLPGDDRHAPLLDALQARPDDDLVAAPLLVEGRRAALVVTGKVHQPGTALARLGELARSAGDSLARVLRARHR